VTVAKIDTLLDDMMKRGGSDLHVAAGYPPMARIRGDLTPIRDEALEARHVEDLLFELVSATQRARFASDLELEFALGHRDIARFRVTYFQRTSGVGAVFRLVPGRVLTLAEIGGPEVLARLAERRSGLVLVTGPTASGRSTSLAAMVDHVNKTRACHVLTIEKPLEFVHEPRSAQITHREVGVHASSVEAALRSAVRENPDVVLVSSLDSPVAIKLALELATSGVLVLASFRSRGAVQTVDRLLGAFAPLEQPQIRGLLADALAGIVAQQLVRTADGKGRLAVHEVLVGTPAITTLVREGKNAELAAAMQSGQAHGMQTMDSALERLLAASRITPEAALERAVDKEAFAQAIARVRPDLADAIA